MIRKFAVVGLVVALATTGFGQGFGGGQGPGQGPGGGRGMMRGFGGMRFDADISMLVNRKDVQTELKLSDDQKAKLADFRQQQRDAMRKAFDDMRNSGGTPPSPDTMRAEMKKRQDDAHAKIKEILTDDQFKRLGELSIQRQGIKAVLQEDTQKALTMTPEQIAKVKKLQKALDQANQEAFDRARNQEIDFSQVQTITQKNDKAMDTELGKVLTDAQKAKLKELGGAPFTFDPAEDQRGFGGPGGRGGRGGFGGGQGGPPAGGGGQDSAPSDAGDGPGGPPPGGDGGGGSPPPPPGF